MGSAVTKLTRSGVPVRTLYIEGSVVDPQPPLSESPPHDGALISLDDPAGCPLPEPAGLIEVRVVSGPDAGGVFRLGPGVVQIGGDPDAAVPVQDASLPPAAVTVEVHTDGTATVTPKTQLPTWLDGTRLSGPAPWRVGGQLVAGWTVFELAVPAPAAVSDYPVSGAGPADPE